MKIAEYTRELCDQCSGGQNCPYRKVEVVDSIEIENQIAEGYDKHGWLKGAPTGIQFLILDGVRVGVIAEVQHEYENDVEKMTVTWVCETSKVEKKVVCKVYARPHLSSDGIQGEG